MTIQFDDSFMRDYFAAHALAGAIANDALGRIAKEVKGEKADMTLDGVVKVTNRLLAENVYRIADAMLAAREASK